jgi:hypothetical protein
MGFLLGSEFSAIENFHGGIGLLDTCLGYKIPVNTSLMHKKESQGIFPLLILFLVCF